MDTATWVSLGVNGLLGLVAFFGGLWVNGLKEAQKRVDAEVAALREKVAEGCVRRDDYLLMRTEMLERLKAIEDKLDRLIGGGKS
ncbi:hypothetical protein [Solidesulfovibrio carbinolicus]|uniref:Uncharacterized protein n=1 Tax=Solidesulfovibrio carbinolicus TaxID=296842 RepID=A0A4P6HKM1_9BACT|nr:hypothetical protein [Solidesulfovibrio carbinolicus]QAZ67044.1 hypothetical protein C3Y92_07295 [Solidesulfovibrio carbinolicus]